MTINIDQSRKLCELGVKKAGLKVWGVKLHEIKEKPPFYYLTDSWMDIGRYSFVYPAYDAEELISMLKGDLYMFRGESGWWWCGEEYGDPCEHGGATVTEALANKLIYDIENGITTIEEVNK